MTAERYYFDEVSTMKTGKYLLPIMCIFVAMNVQAQYSVLSFRTDVTKVGTTAVPFLTIGVGARANAMGGAFASVANDVTALYWNPAGIATLKGSQIALIHSDWIADLRHDFIGLSVPLGGLGTVGIQLNALTMDDISVRTPEYPEGTGERASSYDMALGLSFARALTDRLSIGGSVKYVKSQLWHMSAQTVAFDCGVLLKNIFDFIQLGASMTNMGGKMKYGGRDNFIYHDIRPSEYGNNEKIDAELTTGSYNLPVAFRSGISAVVNKASSWPLLLAVEFYEPSDNVRSLNMGGEWGFYDKVFLRAGYSSLFEDNSERGLTVGGGLKLQVPKSAVEILLDYSYEDFGIFQNTQKFALCISF
jgi:hypothetical protein